MPTFEGYLHPFLIIPVLIFMRRLRIEPQQFGRLFFISRPFEPYDPYIKNSYKKCIRCGLIDTFNISTDDNWSDVIGHS